MLRQIFIPGLALPAHLTAYGKAGVGVTSTKLRVTRFWWVIGLPGPDVSNARHLASPSELARVYEVSLKGAGVIRRDVCTLCNFTIWFSFQKKGQCFSLPLLPFIFSFFASCPLPQAGRSPSPQGINWNYPPGNWNILVKFSRWTKTSFVYSQEHGGASLASSQPGLKKITQQGTAA